MQKDDQRKDVTLFDNWKIFMPYTNHNVCTYMYNKKKIDTSVKRQPQKQCLILNNMIIWKYQVANYIKNQLTDMNKAVIISFWK